MSQQYWTEALSTAKERLEALRIRLDAIDAEREEIVNEVVQMEQLVKSLTPLTTDSPLDKVNTTLIKNAANLNLADACRRVLAENDRYMTPIEIRNTLVASEFDLSNYSNPLASIHGVLKRIAESGDIEKHDKGGTTLYKWNLPRFNPPATSGGMSGKEQMDMIMGTGRYGKTNMQRIVEQAMNPPKSAVQRALDELHNPAKSAAQQLLDKLNRGT
jgi:hypothetical protein